MKVVLVFEHFIHMPGGPQLHFIEAEDESGRSIKLGNWEFKNQRGYLTFNVDESEVQR